MLIDKRAANRQATRLFWGPIWTTMFGKEFELGEYEIC